MRRGRMILIALLVVLLIVAALLVLGPREPVDLAVEIERDAIAADPVAFVAAREAEVPALRPEMAKEIVYAFPRTRAKTPLAIVYVHGFSATKEELRPVPDLVARALGANLFYTRLAGHGADGDALAEPSVRDWVTDFAEALAVGRALGERTVVIAASTGATLAAIGATEPGLREGMDALVQVSPNYALKNRLAFVLELPFAEWIAPTLGGAERSFETFNDKHAAGWTTRYPTVATLPMAALVREARSRTYENVVIPSLFIFDEGDVVVDHSVTREVAARWGAATGAHVNIELVSNSGDPNRHVVAGDALSPSTTEPVARTIANWIEAWSTSSSSGS